MHKPHLAWTPTIPSLRNTSSARRKQSTALLLPNPTWQINFSSVKVPQLFILYCAPLLLPSCLNKKAELLWGQPYCMQNTHGMPKAHLLQKSLVAGSYYDANSLSALSKIIWIGLTRINNFGRGKGRGKKERREKKMTYCLPTNQPEKCRWTSPFCALQMVLFFRWKGEL